MKLHQYSLRMFIWILLLFIQDAYSDTSYPPAFDNNRFLIVKENVPIGHSIGKINVTDRNPGDTISITADGSATRDLINVSLTNSSSHAQAELILKKKLDRDDEPDQRYLYFKASDGTNEVTATYTLAIEDVNDVAPRFSNPSYQFNVKENTPVGNLVYSSISASDPDNGNGGSFTFSLQSDSGVSAKFSITTAQHTGQIYLNSPLNYEDTTFYQYTVTAKDRGGLNSSADLIIKVDDVQDTPPFFQGLPYMTSIKENTNISTSVLTVRAIDGDRGVPNPVNFTLQNGTCGNIFEINAVSGLITLKKSPDRDGGAVEKSGGVCTLNVTCTEIQQHFPQEGNITATKPVIVTIEDVNDNAPAFENHTYHATVMENVTSIPITFSGFEGIRIEDIDQGDNSKFSVSITYTNGTAYTQLEPTPTSVISEGLILLRLKDSPFDYEKIQSITFLVVATETNTAEKRSSIATVNLKITDTNDNSPVFPNSSKTVTIPEGAANGTEVITITATDADSGRFGEIHYVLRGGGSTFEVDSNTGKIYTICKPVDLDYDEGKNLYYLTLDAVDGGGSRTPVSVEVYLLDVNDNPPVFTSNQYEITISELHTEFPNPPFKLTATDKDKPGTNNSKVMYRLHPPSYLVGNITINDTTGEITLDNPIDYESLDVSLEGKIRLIAEAFDLGNPSMNSSVTVLINVKDENDVTPVFPKAPYVGEIYENATKGTKVVTVEANDIDITSPNNDIRYYISTGAADRFVINGTSGLISVAIGAKFDRETINLYNITVLAIDQGTPPHTGTATVSATILDVNDEFPRFNNTNQQTLLKENTVSGTFVIDCSAMDPDTDNDLFYTISKIEGTHSGDSVNSSEIKDYFTIDEHNGSVLAGNGIDRETVTRVVLTITVEDKNAVWPKPQVTSDTVTINIEDMNDNPPVFTQKEYTRDIVESATRGSDVTTVSANDVDTEGQPISYYISRNPGNAFTIDGGFGTITVNDSTALDREQDPQMNITVGATDGKYNTTTLVIINLLDVNDNDPYFVNPNTSIEIREDNYTNFEIATYFADDNDTGLNAKITYKINSGSDSLFFINESSGVLSVHGDLDRDPPGKSSFTLVLLAKDNPTDTKYTRTGTTTIDIQVLDVNDNSPVFTSPEYHEKILETIRLGSPVLTVSAEDKDQGENAKVLYFIRENNGTGLFEINPTGIISVNASLVNKINTYWVEVYAEDNGSPPKNSSTSVYIEILDENNNKPEFTNLQETYSVYECARNGTVIANITARDQDSGDNAKVKYTFINDTALFFQPFTLISDTGEIKLKGHIDADKRTSYQVRINASDHGIPIRYTLSKTVTIQILDTNDNPPEFLHKLYNATVMEEKENVTVKTIVATDKDSGSETEYSIELVSPSKYTDYFSINTTADHKGEITVIKALDREKVRGSINLTIKATDATIVGNYSEQCGKEQTIRSNSTTTKVHVTIQDIDDNPPKFKRSMFSVGVRRSVELGKIVYDFRNDTEDPDIAPNNVHTFSLLKITKNFKITDVIKPCKSGPQIEKPLCLTENGTVVTNMLFQENLKGYFNLSVSASDKAGNSTAKLQVFLIGDSQTAKITFAKSKQYINSVKDIIMGILSNATGFIFVADEIVESTLGNLNSERTDLYFHVQHPDTKDILPASEALSLLDQNAGKLVDFMNRYTVIQIQELQSEALTNDDEQLKQTYILIAVIALLGAIIMVLGYFLCSTISKYKRRLKAATVRTADVDTKDSLALIPGSNEFAEKTNPLLNKEIKQPVQPDDNDSQNSLDVNEVDYDNRYVPLSEIEEKEKVMEMYGEDYFIADDNIDALQLALDEHSRQMAENYKNELLKNTDHNDIDLGIENPVIYEQLETTEV